MPEKETLERAEQQGKSPSTQAGEFIREEMHHIREGKHGARSPQQAIAIGLSKARRVGVKLGPPKRGSTSAKIRKQAERDLAKGRSHGRHTSRTRSRAATNTLKHERRSSASHSALSRQTRSAAGGRAESRSHKGQVRSVPRGAKGS